MRILACPIDGTPIDENRLTCEKEHKFYKVDGYYDFVLKDVKVDDVLEKVAPLYENVWAPIGMFITSHRTYSSIMREIADHVSGDVVVDVGTGPGRLFDFVKCGTCVGVDLSSKFLKMLVTKRKNVIAVKGNALGLPILSEVADGVASSFVLHMIPNPSVAIKEISRITKKGGNVAVTVLANSNFFGRTLSKWWKLDLKSKDVYASYFSDNGIEVKEMKNMGPWVMIKGEKR
ncbi:class I SAM-dependent methyltransferase [Sulfuracidifex tepidarius]|uniref:Ubiquinone/menaquinone biosynthesis C-methyltransferase UbiE n=1 Tax=Sulfuracidifex tepidarius TaxID=1294262 RepID=A0A510E2W1_9CREN|nr:class I SAM-dependent methyltransferase [Sulfuracidifex tepidarius]BBG26844.1 Ubiquinone/menaquinone biosynthesis C-methyltransferase UbiE [Sulfuracidifex tepidarius]